MKEYAQISNSELEIMKIIWGNKEPIRASEIIKILENVKDWKPKTIKTLLRRLSDKEIIGFKIEGNAYYYYSNVDENEYIEQEMDSFLGKLFDGSISRFMCSFVKDRKLSSEQIVELIDILGVSKNKVGALKEGE